MGEPAVNSIPQCRPGGRRRKKRLTAAMMPEMRKYHLRPRAKLNILNLVEGRMAGPGAQCQAKQTPRYRNGGEHAHRYPQEQGNGKAHHLASGKPAAKPVEDNTGNKGGDVAIPDGGPSPGETPIYGPPQWHTPPELLLHPLKDEDVGIHRHTQGDDKAGDARQCEGNGEEFEDGQEQGPG